MSFSRNFFSTHQVGYTGNSTFTVCGDFLVRIPKSALRLFSGNDDVRAQPPNLSQYTIKQLCHVLFRELLWVESRDVWCIQLDPVWVDFFGARAVGANRPTPFVDAFPLTVWVYMKDPLLKSADENQGFLNTLDNPGTGASATTRGSFGDPLRSTESLKYGVSCTAL